jgi:radical SAM superfamily enzyme with C-terminal helix-hairpin-helix motif
MEYSRAKESNITPTDKPQSMVTLIDCYTDEPAGLGVPPYLGVYPRYIAGRLALEGQEVNYLTIDDVRLCLAYRGEIRRKQQTDIRIYNLTRSYDETRKILESGQDIIVVCGVHVPGKYLSALPGTLHEITWLLKGVRARKILTGPAATSFGTRLEGGKAAEEESLEIFDDVIPDMVHSYEEISKAALKAGGLVKQIPGLVVAELETQRGCPRKPGCSFCTEPLKNKLEFRKPDDIIAEAKALHAAGVRHFRLGKQSDFFLWSPSKIEHMLESIRGLGVETLHIDNIDPMNVTDEKVQLVSRLCTPGNIAALGVESFDPRVIEENRLHSGPDDSLQAIRTINKYGAKRGTNGMPAFLPGVNILFGLIGETRKTHEENMKRFRQIMDENLLLRRINIRQVAAFPGTLLYETCGDRNIKKHRRFYWKWRNEIRQEIDNPMLARLVPKGHLLKGVRMEIYDGNTTFGRQIGTYPLIVGVKERLELGRMYDIAVTGHMLRSVVGRVS